MANKVVEAYDAGRIAEAMTTELSIRTAISTLNALYEHSIHQRRFYKDLSPIFGDDYVFSMKDLRISTKVDDPCILYRNIDKTPEVIYYVCITTIVLSVLTKAIQTLPNLRFLKLWLRVRPREYIPTQSRLRRRKQNPRVLRGTGLGYTSYTPLWGINDNK